MSNASHSIDPYQHHNALKPGASLNWYRIESILGQGGFGITYLAVDTNLEHKVAIKEYLPSEFSVRGPEETVGPVSTGHSKIFDWGLKRFMEEARTLARFRHPNIVRVVSFFEANNTAYMVMEYEAGDNLATLINAGEHFGERRIREILMPILDGLEKVHAAGFIHRDIKPSNIIIRGDGSPVLIDFGSARHAMRGQTKTMTSLVTPGYAPFEQYHDAEGKQGPWTDIYALGATCYCAITGKPPVDALKRGMVQFEHKTDVYLRLADIKAGKYSELFLEGLDWALRFKDAERPQSVGEWKKVLDGEAEPPPTAANVDGAGGTAARQRRPAAPAVDSKTVPYRGPADGSPSGSRGTRILIVVVFSMIVAAVGYVYVYQPQLAGRVDTLIDSLASRLSTSPRPPAQEPAEAAAPVGTTGFTPEMLFADGSKLLAELAGKQAEAELQVDLVRLEQEKQALAKRVRRDADKNLRQSLARKVAAVDLQLRLIETAQAKRLAAEQALRESNPRRRAELAQQIIELQNAADTAARRQSMVGNSRQNAAEIEADLLVALTETGTEKRLQSMLAGLEREKQALDEKLQRNPADALQLQAAKKGVEIELQARQVALARETRQVAEAALQEGDDGRLAAFIVTIAELQTQALAAHNQQVEPVISEIAQQQFAGGREAEIRRQQAERSREDAIAQQREQERLQAEIARLEEEKRKLAELARQEAEKKRAAELAKRQAQETLRARLAEIEADKQRQAEKDKLEAERRLEAELEQMQASEKARMETARKVAEGLSFEGLSQQQAVDRLSAALAQQTDLAADDIDVAALEKIVRERIEAARAAEMQRAADERSRKSEKLLVTAQAFYTDDKLEQALQAFREAYDLNASAQHRNLAVKGIADTMEGLYALGNSENWQVFRGTGIENMSGEYIGDYTTTERSGKNTEDASVPTLVAHQGSKLTLAAIGLGIVILADLDGSRGVVDFHDTRRELAGKGTIDTSPLKGVVEIEWQNDDGKISGKWRSLDQNTIWYIDVSGRYIAEISNAHASIFRKKSYEILLTDLTRTGDIGRPDEIVGRSADEMIEIRGRKTGVSRIEFEFVSRFANIEGTGQFDIIDNQARRMQGSWVVPGSLAINSSGGWTMQKAE